MYEDSEDLELEHELRQAIARFDPVPADAVESAVDGFTWRTIDGELAELVFDSLGAQERPVAVRGGSEPRSVSFQGGGLSIELEISCTRRSCRLVGQLIPARRATVEIRQRGESVTVEADDLGRFRALSVPAGLLSLRCGLGPDLGGGAVVTEWIAI